MMLMYIYFMNLLWVILILISLYLYFYDKGLVMEWMVMTFNGMNIEILMLIDWISMIFVSVVLMISSMVLMYSLIYMEMEKNFYRYNYLVLFFVMSMILMILSPNMVSILIGWDGLGLVSYCLVIYYQNSQSYNSGMLTVLMNRVGDVMILMIIAIMFIYGSWNLFMIKDMKFLVILILIAGMTKSAQIPFSSWLPSAMAAPTPVSALVHSSTLVTAGVYLLIRFWSVMNKMNIELKNLMVMSILTMFMSGLMAIFEYDLKKIIALSTLSQLGMMMMILSVGFPMMSLYHLLTHAIFKSLLFMGAGILIHLMKNNQDIRLMGGLNEYIPFTMMSFNLSLFSLCGMPFMSGFYSKDLIMEMIYYKNMNYFMFILSLVSLMLTLMYSIRLMYYMFFGEMKFFSIVKFKEENLMNYSMIVLMILSLIFGSILNWLFFFEVVYLSIEWKMMTLMLMMNSLMIIMIISMMNMLKLYYFSYMFSSMWFMNYLFMNINKPFLVMMNLLYKKDKLWMEFVSSKITLNMYMEFKNYSMNFKYKIYMLINMFFLIIIMMNYLV
uniref:NADH-ubiquinone oxidoreductase chain 5 n=1 Tax=Cryptopone sauteri TaxID=255801 RepID=A0A411HSM3_9HYME|nr:NADH dehydrogenase subunit 5 [Cryptopone sauteri]QBB73600.1 NADH dehydrogenase subunit 5 [Cryptopone sauteri]